MSYISSSITCHSVFFKLNIQKYELGKCGNRISWNIFNGIVMGPNSLFHNEIMLKRVIDLLHKQHRESFKFLRHPDLFLHMVECRPTGTFLSIIPSQSAMNLSQDEDLSTTYLFSSFLLAVLQEACLPKFHTMLGFKIDSLRIFLLSHTIKGTHSSTSIFQWQLHFNLYD